MSELEEQHPLNRGGISTKPIWQMPIPLVMDGDCICWPDGKERDRTPKLSSEDLCKAIIRSAGQHLPSSHLASFGPGDVVVVATDGLFWITPDWSVSPLDEET
ncbi:MAG: hypothetical protein AAGL17_20255, partial [Cyanobacteria bacterium J06576_12]